MDKVSMRAHSLVVSATSLVLAACGGGGGGSSSSSSSSSGGAATDRVALTATAPTTPVPSAANTEFVFVLSNPSTSLATNAALTLTLGSGLSISGVTCTATGTAVCPVDPATLVANSISGGNSVTFRVSVAVAAGTRGEVTSSASVTAIGDTATANNSAQVVITAYAADVSILGSTTATDFVSGGQVPYSFTVTNSGPDVARNIVLETTASTGQVMQSVTCAASGGATCPPGTGSPMTVPTLPSGGSLTYTVDAQLSANTIGQISSTMLATAPGDANLTNNSATVSAQARIPTSPNSPSFVRLTSETGDWVGSGYGPGTNYAYSLDDATFEAYTSGGHLTIKVHGDELWTGEFYMPSNLTQIEPGMYIDARGAPAHDPANGGLQWYGDGRGCDHNGWFRIDGVTYEEGQIASVDLRFEQRCAGVTAALRGQIHWVAGDDTRPPGPVNPPPAGLWAPAPGTTPTSGNYFYVESDPMDFIGQGDTRVLTQANSVFRVVQEANGELGVSANGDTEYGGRFLPMVPLTRLAPGYYADVSGVSVGNPTRGRMDMGGNSRGCNEITGWFVIDNIAFNGDDIIALDLRFEQHCEGNTPSLRGRVHWRSDDPTLPPGPVVPPPAGLWAPPAGAIPASGNAIYMQSPVGDHVGQGLTALYTPLNSIITVGAGGMDPVGNRFQLEVQGDQWWTGYFQAMNTLPDLREGYYGGLLRFPFGNPVKGSLDWTGEGRGCNDSSGWFVIDDLEYTGSILTSIELRFEQRCEPWMPPMYGYIRWSAADTRLPPPPVNPPPAGLWDAPPGATPAEGSYVYQESEPGSWVGRGETHLFTPLDSLFKLTVTGSQVNVEVFAADQWGGYFTPMLPLEQLQVGYYGNLAGNNIAKGTAYWSGNGRACGPTYGWFMVDSVTYNAGSITSLDLRFEHRCFPEEPAVRGKIHWRFDDPLHPAPPQNPAPTDLWAPPSDVVPATGNFLYVTSDAGDLVGMGETHLFVPPANIGGGSYYDGFQMSAGANNEFFTVQLKPMISIPRLQVGYYPTVRQRVNENPVVGGLEVGGNQQICTNITGWFVIDSITFNGEDITSIQARFEQHCEGAAASVRGALRWSKQ